MNSEVIKFVAGGGKTTYSIEYLRKNANGIYLAFTNSVVNDIRNKGYLAKTVDSFFSSFIIPKFISSIPIIASGAKIKFIDLEKIPIGLKGVSNLHIGENGKIYNRGKSTVVDINMTNEKLHNMRNFPNEKFIKYVFSKKELRLTDEFRAELSLYLIKQFPNQIIDLIKSRFTYILIDEAQDLNRHREELAKLIYKSDIKLLLLGDDNQNINNGGDWFESLKPTEIRNESYRCPENNCKWIRDNLGIEIYGNSDISVINQIDYCDILKYDDGIRTLLYSQKSGKNIDIINNWKGNKLTIRSAKGSTIECDIVIIGDKLNYKNLYTAITRSKKNVYTTVKKTR